MPSLSDSPALRKFLTPAPAQIKRHQARLADGIAGGFPTTAKAHYRFTGAMKNELAIEAPLVPSPFDDLALTSAPACLPDKTLTVTSTSVTQGVENNPTAVRRCA